MALTMSNSWQKKQGRLKTEGDEGFRNISQIVSWLLNAEDRGRMHEVTTHGTLTTGPIQKRVCGRIASAGIQGVRLTDMVLRLFERFSS
jgi:hypothetical protein